MAKSQSKAFFISTGDISGRASPTGPGTAAKQRAAISIALAANTWNGSRGTSTGSKTAAALFQKVQILIFDSHVAGSGLGVRHEGRGKDQEGKDEN
jgi:hypothetical protein